ncbi:MULTISPECIES: hypothetical protein [Methylococcus]|uniref:Uncharacterized protein n=1 Tax=Methylococcus capsulatus TaxID=414 RepID=A0ABZ2F7B3_METCP|nr:MULTISPECIES: hypothetical protein [Methylococcus]MDF9392386.1 hypothetical protein [Methylococcus capsulatus]
MCVSWRFQKTEAFEHFPAIARRRRMLVAGDADIQPTYPPGGLGSSGPPNLAGFVEFAELIDQGTQPRTASKTTSNGSLARPWNDAVFYHD